MKRLRVSGFLLLVTFLAAVSSAASDIMPPPSVRQLARDIFRELVEIKTTAESGSLKAAEAMAARLRSAGFPPSDIRVLGETPDRTNLVARLRGTGKQRPILFLAHLDVVEARREDWSTDPFQFIEKDGYFYGRGTLDIKDEVADLVTNLIRLKEEGYTPSRDVIVALTGDEELVGETSGARWLVEQNRDLVDAEYVINLDAGGGQIKDGRYLRNVVQTSEKMYATYRLEVTHPGGHSSLPTPDNAIYRLAAGLVRLSEFQFPVKLNETTRAYFKTLGTQENGAMHEAMLGVIRTPPDPEAIKVLETVPHYNSTMRNTCVATMLNAGHAENALPQRAEATIQCRLLPGADPEAVRLTLSQVVNDPQITVSLANQVKSSPASPLLPELMTQVERITAEMWPEVIVLPVMDPWSTDGIHFRRAGIPTYGISAIFFDIDDVRAHGKDERVLVRAFYEGVEFMYRLMKALTR